MLLLLVTICLKEFKASLCNETFCNNGNVHYPLQQPIQQVATV